MKSKFTMMTIAAGISLTAFGLSPYTLENSGVKNSDGMLSRDTAVHTAKVVKGDSFGMNALKKAAQKKTARVLKAGEELTSPYGTIVEVLTEDFSKLTTGSIEAPDMDTDLELDFGEYEYPWWNFKAEYTQQPNWGIGNGYSAGGCLYLDGTNTDGAKLSTCNVDVSGHCRIAGIRFRARTLTGTVSGNFLVEAAETFNMGPTWDTKEPFIVPDITSEWRYYELPFFKDLGSSTIFNMVLMPAQDGNGVGIYIDDVTVYQVDQYVDTPVILAHSEYKGTSFKANWEPVADADFYLLNVYSIDDAGQIVDFLFDQKAETNSFTVEGVESGKTYYYTVRSVKGKNESIETLPVEVFDLEAPVLNPATEIKDMKYTASWNEVPSAERYNYWAYSERKAEADGEFPITDEDFTGVTTPDGSLSGLTLENPSYTCYSEMYIKEFKQAGWRGTNCMPYTDYICVDAWQYLNGQGDAGLISPEMDFSKDGGKINVSVSLYGEIADMYDENNQPVPCQTQCAVALFNFNEEKGNYEQVELVYIEDVTPSWGDHTVTLTKGTSRSTIGIYAVRAPGNLYIDNLKVTQAYKQGDVLREPFLFSHWYEGTSIEVTVPRGLVDSGIYHRVNAVKAASAATQWTEATYKESLYSDTEKVADHVSGIENVSLEEAAAVTVNGNTVIIANPAGENVAVYNVDGTQIFADNSGKTNYAVTVQNGVCIVKIGEKAFKTAI